MISPEERERLKNMSQEERTEELLDSTSDCLRSFAKKIAMMKAIAFREANLLPEDFDKAWNREYAKAWERVKEKNSHELACMAFLDMLAGGADPEELLG